MFNPGAPHALSDGPRRAAVTPRVRTSPASGALPLERVISDLVDARVRGVVLIHAPAGGGKTSALAHLQCTLGERSAQVHLRDEPRIEDTLGCPDELTIATQRGALPGDWLAVYELVPWTEDEWIEYLAANHRPMVASVMARLKDDPTRHALQGSPQLWTIALDAMAADVSLKFARDAIRQHLTTILPDVWSANAAGVAAMIAFTGSGVAPQYHELPDAARSLLRHHIVRVLLAAQHVAMALGAGEDLPLLTRPLPPELVDAAGEVLRTDLVACARLASFLRLEDRQLDAAAASLLLAADPTWHPGSLAGRLLRRACLDGAVWTGTNFDEVDLIGASLRGANLRGASFNRAVIANADFWHADLGGASLCGASASDADFTGARLALCKLPEAQLWGARFDGADLVGSNLMRADLQQANLTGARARGANLRFAQLNRTIVTDADLSEAYFVDAVLSDVILRAAILDGATFASATLVRCDLEGIELSRANFAGARMRGSLLTGSRMPNANFRGASLVSTGLSEIDWPGADLRDADFTNASFHMGSSRSGLVGSPIASEGTRTGFYTDDYNDQDFKAPEEIRKANLCGADLRGAKVEDADFYLVDLRGAKYTREQGEHFARCGAILRSRVA